MTELSEQEMPENDSFLGKRKEKGEEKSTQRTLKRR